MRSKKLISIICGLLENLDLEKERFKKTLVQVLYSRMTKKHTFSASSLRELEEIMASAKERLDTIDDYDKELKRLANPEFLSEEEYFTGMMLALMKTSSEQERGESQSMFA